MASLSSPLCFPKPRKSIRKFRAKAMEMEVENIVNTTTTTVANPQITWQIAAGAIAGVTPFVVAGIEFGKRIAAQRRCNVCGGSGLVRREKYYFRCNSCGGFLPWQSWKRFFTS